MTAHLTQRLLNVAAHASYEVPGAAVEALAGVHALRGVAKPVAPRRAPGAR